MKKIINKTLCAILILCCIICISACVPNTDPWENAQYTEDTVLGTGANTAIVTVEVNEHIVTFTIHTDKTILGEALFENELITGEESEYGLYIKTVNGILADFNVNKRYWALYINGEYAMSGVDTTKITAGDSYSFKVEK